MKKFKVIDFWINVVLIIGFAILCLVKMDDSFLYGYFTVGAWQVISMVVHTLNRKSFPISATRNTYHWVTSLSIVAMLSIVYFFVLLFIAPLMALFYTCLCGFEIFKNKKDLYENF